GAAVVVGADRRRAPGVVTAGPALIAWDRLAAGGIGVRRAHVAAVGGRASDPLGAEEEPAGPVRLTAGRGTASGGALRARRRRRRRVVAAPVLALRAPHHHAHTRAPDAAVPCAVRVHVAEQSAARARAQRGRNRAGRGREARGAARTAHHRTD